MKIMIIGCGRLGAELARFLSQGARTITVVDSEPSAFERLGPPFKGDTFLGNGLDRDVLVRGGIERTDALAALTASDDVNVVIARLASQIFKVPRVVARVHDPHKAEIYRRLGVLTVSPVTLGTQRLAELLTFSQLNVVYSLGSGEVGIVELDAPPILIGKAVNELTLPGEIRVIAITRGGRTHIPTLGTIFQQGDMIHVAVSSASTDRLKALLGLT